MSIINDVLDVCEKADEFHPDRSLHYILSSAVEEIGELSTEINIAQGFSYKNPGVDGIIGEGVDVIISVLDIIYKANPGITEDQLAEIASKKCKKWLSKINSQ